MKRLLLAAAAISAIGAVAGCATPTPYQPAAASHGGYGSRAGYGFRDQKLDSDHWSVTFAGNSLTSRETVESYLLYRAAELTVQQGYDWFETTDRKTERHSRYYANPDPFYGSGFGYAYGWGWRPYWRYWGGAGMGAWDPWYGGPFWANSVDINEINRYEASAEIVMGKGPPPADHRVFNAREIMTNLGPKIVLPEPPKT